MSVERPRVAMMIVDTLPPERAAVAGDYPELYRAMFAVHDLDLVMFDAHLGVLPDSLDGFDAVFIGGSKFSSIDDDQWILDLIELVVDAYERDVALLGVCFGHQLIARALGGEVVQWDSWNVGAIDYEFEDGTEYTLLAVHQDQVIVPPEGAEVIASAPGCDIAGYVLGDQVVTIQPHPEFVPELAAVIYDGRREAIGSDLADEAIDTARSKEIHGAEFVAEMVGFLRDHVASRSEAGAGS